MLEMICENINLIGFIKLLSNSRYYRNKIKDYYQRFKFLERVRSLQILEYCNVSQKKL